MSCAAVIGSMAIVIHNEVLRLLLLLYQPKHVQVVAIMFKVDTAAAAVVAAAVLLCCCIISTGRRTYFKSPHVRG